MPVLTLRRSRGLGAFRGMTVLALAALMVPLATLSADAGRSFPAASAAGSRAVVFHGYRVDVPISWRVVDLASHPDACVRFDRPAVYLGAAGDQSSCPAHLIGGAPGLHLQTLDASALAGVSRPTLIMRPAGSSGPVRLPSIGPATVAVEGAGVLVTGVYGPESRALVQQMLSAGTVLSGASQTLVGALPDGEGLQAIGFSVPGNYVGKGFDTCGAPSQALMDAWWPNSDYASIGVYIGGMSRGCDQPNLTPTWVSRQVGRGWHLVPTYVGRQAPCSGFRNRMSYDPGVAYAQGRAEAADAMVRARALGIAAPSTIYSDIEGYNSSIPSCVAAVMSYVSGWTRALHMRAYGSAVYSSASSGIRDLSTRYDNPAIHRPDDVWIAWWNDRADVDGGGYVPDSHWSYHQRDHQYAGDVTESHGGYALRIDRDFLDVSTMVLPPAGCPTKLDFTYYRMLRPGFHGAQVVAAQCLLARVGFDPGAANGIYGWRTTANIRAFKASRGIYSEDSAIRRWAWTALASAGPTQFLHLGSTGERVLKVQRALTARFQRVVAITGTYDANTRNAVLGYQRARHLAATGTVGVTTWNAMHAGL